MSPLLDLVRENELVKFLFETTPAAIVITDLVGIIETVNQTTLTWFGYEKSDLVGRPIGSLLSLPSVLDIESFWTGVLSQAREVGTTGSPKQCEYTGRRKDATSFSLQVSWQLFADPEGCRVIGSMREVTERQRRTEKRIAGERVTAVMEMVSGLAHKNRNAMHRAQSCLDLLKLDLAGKAELVQLAEQIRLALSDLSRNYEDVKEYASHITLKRSCIDLTELCQATFDDLWEQYRVSTPQLRIACEGDCRYALVDPVYMRQVFRHVLENCIHASPHCASIEWDCIADPIYQDLLEVRVRDHGVGLSAEVAKRMFDPFFTTKQHGTGLGLAVARRIVEAHDGTIDAENDPEGGAVVRIRLPKATA